MLTIVIQAGGESRRMGQDKALLPFLGQPLVARVLERVTHIADEVVITTNSPQDYQFLNVPLASDLMPGRGALGGLYTALSAANHPLVAVIACDMPFINARLLAAERDALVETQVDVVIPQTGEGLEPFHAIYRRAACLKPIEFALQSGKWRVDSWFNQVKMHPFPLEKVLKIDPQLLSFWNVNTPQDLQAAVQLAAQFSKEGKA